MTTAAGLRRLSGRGEPRGIAPRMLCRSPQNSKTYPRKNVDRPAEHWAPAVSSLVSQLKLSQQHSTTSARRIELEPKYFGPSIALLIAVRKRKPAKASLP